MSAKAHLEVIRKLHDAHFGTAEERELVKRLAAEKARADAVMAERYANLHMPQDIRERAKTWGMASWAEVLWNNAFQAGYREALRAAGVDGVEGAMMKLSEIRAIIAAITYKPGWSIEVACENGIDRRPYVQLAVDERSDATLDPTGKTGTRTPWKSAKRYLSYHMCRQEIVGAVMGLISDAEMHEVREWFRYRGASIFNPHLDPDVLVEVARKASSFNMRQNAMTMLEMPDAA